MLNGQLYINGKDAYLTWGIFLDETALSTLMTPAPNKEFISNVWYRCIYLSCTQFSQFIREMAKFSLKLNEPDPSDRGETSKYTS